MFSKQEKVTCLVLILLSFVSSVNWFEHSEPFVLKITGKEIVDECPRGAIYGKNFMDAVMRTMTIAQDRQYYGSSKRETHFMAFSWAVSSNIVSVTKFFQNLYYV
jgi:hypothetical protein